jgi:hypothetical protein
VSGGRVLPPLPSSKKSVRTNRKGQWTRWPAEGRLDQVPFKVGLCRSAYDRFSRVSRFWWQVRATRDATRHIASRQPPRDRRKFNVLPIAGAVPQAHLGETQLEAANASFRCPSPALDRPILLCKGAIVAVRGVPCAVRSDGSRRNSLPSLLAQATNRSDRPTAGAGLSNLGRPAPAAIST